MLNLFLQSKDSNRNKGTILLKCISAIFDFLCLLQTTTNSN